MFLKLQLLTILSSIAAWAGGPADLGRLQIIDGSTVVFEAATGVVPFEPGGVMDPLLCERASLKLQQLQRLDSQINEALERLSQIPIHKQDRLLMEIENLKSRRETTFEFLSSPAPILAALWDVSSLGEEQLNRLRSDEVRYQLDSYALIWEAQSIWAETPSQTASLLYTPRPGQLKVILQASVVSFCDRKPLTLKIWL